MPDCGAIPARFVDYIGQLRSTNGRRRMNIYPGLTAQPWYDPGRFAIVRDLEENATQIIAEAHTIDGTSFQDEGENIGRMGRWSIFFLFERGRKNEENCRVCPTTTAIVEAHRTVTTLAGMIYFSCLDPNTHVASHKGPTNMRLRCHFGVEIPDQCGIRVNGVAATWKSGQCIVFDDSFAHEVWNSSHQRRTILVVDVWHPDLSEDEVQMLDGLQRYAVGQRLRLSNYRAQDYQTRAQQAAE
jgi:aspartyl/asparaginyl beta-hydroxylase (cupin superfamily)